MSQYLDARKVVRILITVAIFAAFALMFLPFWKPLLMAALFSFALAQWVDRMGPKKNRRLPTLLILGGFSLVVVIPVLFVTVRVARALTGLRAENLEQFSLYQSLQRMVERWQSTFHELMDRAHLAPGDLPEPTVLFAKGASWLVDQTTTIVANTPELILSLFVFAAALYFFLTEAKAIRHFFLGLGLLEKDEFDSIVSIVRKSSYRTLIASAAVGSVQAAIVAFGAWCFGFPELMLIFIVTFFTSFIPVIGAAPVAIFLALLSLLNGEIGSAIGLAVVAGVAGSVDNFLKPYLVSATMESSVHPVVSLLAIVGAVLVYGIPGLLLGPILMELTVSIIPVLFKQGRIGEHPEGANDGPS